MLNKWIVACCCIFFIQAAQAVNKQIDNVFLQAWWYLDWQVIGSSAEPEVVSTPILNLRYFKKETSGDITIGQLNLNQEDIVRIVKKNFKNVPDTFFKYHEGHAEMLGNIVVNNISSPQECDNRLYDADYVSFSPISEISSGDMFKMARNSNCEAFSYAVYYDLRSNSGKVSFKKYPRSDAPEVGVVPEQSTLIKIKTINEKWALMAVVDNKSIDFIGKPSGYIEFKDLEILN